MTNDTQKPPTLNYPQCSKQKREFHQGALTVVVCRNRRSPNYRNFVDPEHCDACPLRDGEAAVSGNAADTGPGCLHRRPATAGPGGNPTDAAGPGREGTNVCPPDFRAGRRDYLSQTGRGLGTAAEHQRLHARSEQCLAVPAALVALYPAIPDGLSQGELRLHRHHHAMQQSTGTSLQPSPGRHRLQAMPAPEINHALRRLSR